MGFIGLVLVTWFPSDEWKITPASSEKKNYVALLKSVKSNFNINQNMTAQYS